MSYHRCSLVLIGPETCWEPNNSGYYPRNFKTNPPILRNSMKIIDISILENPVFCEWRLFPGNNILTDQKHWKSLPLQRQWFFQCFKIYPIHVRTEILTYHNSDDRKNTIYHPFIGIFGSISWENMFYHMLTHVESL